MNTQLFEPVASQRRQAQRLRYAQPAGKHDYRITYGIRDRGGVFVILSIDERIELQGVEEYVDVGHVQFTPDQIQARYTGGRDPHREHIVDLDPEVRRFAMQLFLRLEREGFQPWETLIEAGGAGHAGRGQSPPAREEGSL